MAAALLFFREGLLLVPPSLSAAALSDSASDDGGERRVQRVCGQVGANDDDDVGVGMGWINGGRRRGHRRWSGVTIKMSRNS